MIEPPFFRWGFPSVGGQNVNFGRATLSWQSSGRWLIEGSAGLWRGLETVGWETEARAGFSVALGGRRMNGHWEHAAPMTIGARVFNRPTTLASAGHGLTEQLIGPVASAGFETTRWGARFGFVMRAIFAATVPIARAVPACECYRDGQTRFIIDAGLALGLTLR